MIWNYAYTPYIWSSFVTVLLLIALLLYSGHRRSVPGALPFMISCLFAILWAAGSVMEYAVVDVGIKVFWVKFQGAWYMPVATAILCFVLEYAWPGRWLTRRNLALLSIPPLLTLGLILTNNLDHLAWRGFAFDGSVLPRLGPGGWITLTYAYALVIANLVILAWLFPRLQYYRWPVAVMLIGQFGEGGRNSPRTRTMFKTREEPWERRMGSMQLLVQLAVESHSTWEHRRKGSLTIYHSRNSPSCDVLAGIEPGIPTLDEYTVPGGSHTTFVVTTEIRWAAISCSTVAKKAAHFQLDAVQVAPQGKDAPRSARSIKSGRSFVFRHQRPWSGDPADALAALLRRHRLPDLPRRAGAAVAAKSVPNGRRL